MIQWYYLVLISSVLMGIATIIEKMTLGKQYASAYNASFSIVAMVTSLFLLPFANFNIAPLYWAIIVLNALFTMGVFLLNARIFRHESLSVTSPLISSLPTLATVVLAFVFLGEKLTLLQYVSVAIMIVATYVLLFEKGSGSLGKSKYVGALAGTIVLTAVCAILTKYILQSVNVFAFLIVTEVLIARYFVVHMQLSYGGLKETLSNMAKYKGAVISTAVLTTMYKLFYYLGVAAAPISLVTPLRNTAFVLMTVVSGGVMFKEKNLKKTLFLSVVLLITLFLLVV